MSEARTSTVARIGSWLDVAQKVIVIGGALLVPLLVYAGTAYLDTNYATAQEAEKHATQAEVRAVEIRSEKADAKLESDIDAKFRQILCLLQRDQGFVWVNGSCMNVKGGD